MSFGYGVGDIIAVSKLAWKVLQNTRQACGQYDELTREVTSLHIVLNRLQVEANNPASLLFGLPGSEALELEHLVHSCGLILKVLDDVLEKYDALGEAKGSSTKLWQRVRFGNTEMQDLSQVRGQISGQAASIALFLQLMSLGSQGRVERLLTEQLGALQELQRAKNPDDRVSVASSERASSILTTYENDDKDFWKQFRRELIAEGCSSDVMSKNRELIVAYIRELETKGVFDIKETSVPSTFLISRESMVSITVSETFDPDDKATNQLIYTRIMASASIRSSIILPYLGRFPSVPLNTTLSSVDLQNSKDDANTEPLTSSKESDEAVVGIQKLPARDPLHPISEHQNKIFPSPASVSSRNDFINAHIPTYALLTGDSQASLKESFQHAQSTEGELEGRDKKSQPKSRNVQTSSISQPDKVTKAPFRAWQPPVYTPYESTTPTVKSASSKLAAKVVSNSVPRAKAPIRPWQAPDYAAFDFTDGTLKSSSQSTPITVSKPNPNPIIEVQEVQSIHALTTPASLPDAKPVISDSGAMSPKPIRRFMREYRIVVMGSDGVDKSSLVIRLMQHEAVMDKFKSQYYPIDEDSYRKQCVIDDEVVILDVLDTAGQEEYSAMREQYMRTGEAFMLVYSITSKESLESLQAFHTQILRIKDKDTFPMILVGNHLEKEDERQVSKEETERVAKLFECPHCEVSSLEGTNVELSFFNLVREVRRWEKSRETYWQQPSTVATIELDTAELESPLSRLKDFLRRRSKQ